MRRDLRARHRGHRRRAQGRPARAHHRLHAHAPRQRGARVLLGQDAASRATRAGSPIEHFRYPGHPPQSRETAILAICDAVEAASRTLKKPDAASIDSLVQRIVYGKLHLGQLDESGLSMGDLRRISDSLRETIRHANHGRIEYPWQKAQQDASASSASKEVTQHPAAPRLARSRPGAAPDHGPSDDRRRRRGADRAMMALAETADLRAKDDASAVGGDRARARPRGPARAPERGARDPELRAGRGVLDRASPPGVPATGRSAARHEATRPAVGPGAPRDPPIEPIPGGDTGAVRAPRPGAAGCARAAARAPGHGAARRRSRPRRPR